MRYALLAVSLIVLTAAAVFWMGRLSASSPAVRSEQGFAPIGSSLEDRHPTLEVAGLSTASGPEETITPASPTPPPAVSGQGGTIKSTDKSAAATAGIAKLPTRTAGALAAVKRERSSDVSRIGRPVGPDGIAFEPVRHGDQ